jgi:hypothetical protein
VGRGTFPTPLSPTTTPTQTLAAAQAREKEALAFDDPCSRAHCTSQSKEEARDAVNRRTASEGSTRKVWQRPVAGDIVPVLLRL